MPSCEEPVLLPSSLSFGVPRTTVEARLVETDRERARVELVAPAPPELERGTGVVVRPDGERNLELVGVVDQVTGTRLDIRLSRAGHREDRWSPREKGQLRFRYLPAPSGLDLDAWVAGEPSPPGPWVEPDPRVEISLGGLAYLDEQVPAGLLLFTFVHDEEAYRLVAEVVRSDPTRRKGVRRVSLRFVRTPERTGAALADILLALQDAALESFVTPCTLDLPPPSEDVAELHEW